MVDCFEIRVYVDRGGPTARYHDNTVALEVSSAYPLQYSPRRRDSLTYQLMNAACWGHDVTLSELIKSAMSTTVDNQVTTDPHVYTEVALPATYSFPEDSSGRKVPPLVVADVNSIPVILSPTPTNDTFFDYVSPCAYTSIDVEPVPDTDPLLMDFVTVGDNVHVEKPATPVSIADGGPLVVKVDASVFGMMRGDVFFPCKIVIKGCAYDHIMLPESQMLLDEVTVEIHDSLPVEVTAGFSTIESVCVYDVPAGSSVGIYRHFDVVAGTNDRVFADPIKPTLTGASERRERLWCVASGSAYVSQIEQLNMFPGSPSSTLLAVCWRNPEYISDYNTELDVSSAWMLTDKSGNNITAVSYAVVPMRDIAVVLDDAQRLHVYSLREPRPSMTDTIDNGAVLVDLYVSYSGDDNSVAMGILGWKAALTPHNLSVLAPVKYRLKVKKPDGSETYLVNRDGEYISVPALDSLGWQAWDNNPIPYTVDQDGKHAITYEVMMLDGSLSRIVRILYCNHAVPIMTIDVSCYATVSALSTDSSNNVYIVIDGTRYKIRFRRDIFHTDFDNKVLYLSEEYDTVKIGGIDFEC